MAGSYLKQSTASQSRAIGPFVDRTDGKTAETGLTIANTDIKLVVNGGASANKNSGGGTHRVNGVYGVTFDATDTATVGEMKVSVDMTSDALPVFHTFWVLEEAIYDALFGASAAGFDANQRVDVGSWLGTAVTTSSTTAKPEVDAFSISNDATAANNAELAFDGTGFGFTGCTMPTVTTLTGHTAQTGDSFARIGAAGAGLTAVPWNASWDAEVQSEVNDALVANNLDHLMLTATAGADMTTEIADNTALSRILANGDTSAFTPSTDGLQPARDAAVYDIRGGVAYNTTNDDLQVTVGLYKDGTVVNCTDVTIDIYDYDGTSVLADANWDTGPAETPTRLTWYAFEDDASALITAGNLYYVEVAATYGGNTYTTHFFFNATS